MVRKVLLWLGLLALGIIAIAVVTALRKPRLPGDLQGAIEAAAAHYKLPAMAACIVTTDSIEVAVTGNRSLAPNAEPVTKDDYWHIASNTKAMTATLAGILYEEGKVQPEDTVREAFNFKVNDGYADVTLSELLLHRSGLPPFTAGAEFDKLDLPTEGRSPRTQRLEFAMKLLGQPPAGEAGEYVYSNAGYGIAAAMLESSTGDDWETLLREKLLDPLNIRARVGWPATPSYPDNPLGHVPDGGGLEAVPIDDDYALPAAIEPAGDLSLPIEDYGRFLQLHVRGLKGLKTKSATQQALPAPATIKQLHEPEGNYSYGWIETRTPGLFESSHDGSTGTFYCTATIDGQTGFAVAVVTNAGHDAASVAVHAVANRLIGVMLDRSVAAKNEAPAK